MLEDFRGGFGRNTGERLIQKLFGLFLVSNVLGNDRGGALVGRFRGKFSNMFVDVFQDSNSKLVLGFVVLTFLG